MQFAVIAIKQNDICSVLVSGDIEDLNIVYDNICGKYSENKLRLIEYDEYSFNDIKDNALEVHKALEGYFTENTLSYDFLVDEE